MDFHQTALILWRSSLGMLMGEFRQFLTDLSAHDRSIFHFWMVTLVNVNRFSPNLVCALIFWRSALGLLIGKVRQFLTRLSALTHLYFQFWMITLLNVYGFSPNFLCALIL